MDSDTKTWVLGVAKAIVVIVYAIVIAFFVILGLAFVLRLFGADPQASFVDWVYRSSERIMAPFRGMFPTTQLNDRSVFDASLLFALIIYSVLGLALHALIDWLARRIAVVRDTQEQQRSFEAYQASITPEGYVQAAGMPYAGAPPAPPPGPPTH